MHLKCFCLWIYRDGIWIKPRQCRDNCRGDQILHRQDNRLLSIVRRTKMMTSYRQIPVPSNKSFIKHPKNLCLFTTKQAGRTLIHRDIRSRTASNDPFPLRWVHWIAAESILVLNDSSVDYMFGLFVNLEPIEYIQWIQPRNPHSPPPSPNKIKNLRIL